MWSRESNRDSVLSAYVENDRPTSGKYDVSEMINAWA
jgi:hypothetical protein